MSKSIGVMFVTRGNTQTVRFQIVDDVTSEVTEDLSLTPEQFTAVMSGRVTQVTDLMGEK